MTHHIADGVVYVDTVLRSSRGEVRGKQAVGSVHVVGGGKYQLRIERVYTGGTWIELDTPFFANVRMAAEVSR